MILNRRITLALLGLIVLTYLFLGWRYAVETPAWQIPDEPAHYNYIRQISEDGFIPVIEIGDWQNDYQEALRREQFNPAYLDRLDTIEYEDHQPPLYYLIMTPIYAVSDGNLQTMRLFSMLIGVVAVVGAFLTVDRLFPDQAWLSLPTAAFVAFIPQNLSIMSGVTNDTLAQALAALIFWIIVIYLTTEDQKQLPRYALLLGFLVGLVFLTKSTIYFLSGIVGLATLIKWRRERWARKVAVQQLAAVIIPALLMGGLWWARNLDVYGGTDFLGLQRHDQVAGEQLKTDDYLEVYLGGDRTEYFKNYAYTTFHSFWGQFGWMAVPMPVRLYRILFGLVGITLVGSGLYFKQTTFTPPQREMLILFTLSILLVFAALVFYNLEFVQFQGRYLFPALIPLGLWAAMGLSGWAGLLATQQPRLQWLPIPMMLLLALLALYALYTYLAPNLHQWS